MSTRLCPICDRPAADDRYRPFCSRRCADVDLQRWFTGAYAVPAEEAPESPANPGGDAAGRSGDDLL
jgi:endogenous inhibitor of DNA gyrase (YacG/DUF329 family)